MDKKTLEIIALIIVIWVAFVFAICYTLFLIYMFTAPHNL